LRFLQGWAAMLRVLRDLLWWRYQTPSTHAFRLPPLQRTQERGTHCVGRVAQFSTLFFPVLKLWMPRPCVLCKGGYDAAGTIRICYA